MFLVVASVRSERSHRLLMLLWADQLVRRFRPNKSLTKAGRQAFLHQPNTKSCTFSAACGRVTPREVGHPESGRLFANHNQFYFCTALDKGTFVSHSCAKDYEFESQTCLKRYC